MKARQFITATVYDKKGRVLSVGVNSYSKTHTRMKSLGLRVNSPKKEHLHAEVAAIIRARHGKPYRIFITRYSRSGEPRLAAPCAICRQAIKEAGIKIVQYTS